VKVVKPLNHLWRFLNTFNHTERFLKHLNHLWRLKLLNHMWKVFKPLKYMDRFLNLWSTWKGFETFKPHVKVVLPLNHPWRFFIDIIIILSPLSGFSSSLSWLLSTAVGLFSSHCNMPFSCLYVFSAFFPSLVCCPHLSSPVASCTYASATG